MGDLFTNDSLTNGTQITVPRYLQEGASLVNIQEFTDVANDTELLYTVPTGKILYITDIVVQATRVQGGASDVGEFRSVAGATVVPLLATSFYNVAEGSYFVYKFSSPLFIVAGTFVWYCENSGADYNAEITATGWLEDA